MSPVVRIPPEQRFWPKVARSGPDECWDWLGSRDKGGYGDFASGGRGGAVVRAHRFAYQLLVGPVPFGLELDHLCGNRACVNPAHLEPVTHAENVRRGANARKIHCPQGHPYDEANTYTNGTSRFCRACGRAAQRRYQLKKKASL